MIPKNLDECFESLDIFFGNKNYNIFNEWKNLPEEKAIGQVHFGFGRKLRNSWGLWTNSELALFFNSLGIFCADDMSGIILTSYHRKINNKPIDLEKQIKFYQDYWKTVKD